MTNQDPIAEREAKIAALQALIDKARECLFRVCERQAFKLTACVPARPGVDDDLVIGDGLEAGKEAVALMRSAPDGDAKLRAENERLRSVLAAVDTSLCRFAQSTTLLVEDDHRGGLLREQRIEGIIDKVRQLELQRSTALDQRDEALAENERLQADLAAARADQAAMARLELDRLLFRYDHGDLGFGPTEPQDLLTDIRQRLAALPAQQPKPDAATAYEGDPKDCAFRGPIWPAWKTVDSAPHHKAVLAAEPGCGMAVAKLWDDGTWRGDMGDHFRPTHWVELPDWPSEFPQSRGEPKPDAATRDGDEVLREWLDPDTEGRPISGWVAVMARVLDEVCRRELARGGK